MSLEATSSSYFLIICCQPYKCGVCLNVGVENESPGFNGYSVSMENSLSYDNTTRWQLSEGEYLTCGLVSVPDSLHILLVCV